MTGYPHMPTVLIVADDLTGALDSAVAFAGNGRRIAVARGVDQIAAALRSEPMVLGVDMASREGNAADAVAGIETLARVLPLGKIPSIIKKVDSRLKGHVRAEVEALHRLSDRTRVVAVPAIPGMGRLQIGGFLTGYGIEDAIDLTDRLGFSVEIPDAETDDALDGIVRAGDAATLWVGARGLAFALSRHRFRTYAPTPLLLTGPILFAIGSRDPVTSAQVALLQRQVHSAPDGAVPEGAADKVLDIVAMTDGGGGRSAAAAGASFADSIAARMNDTHPMTLLASGGETAAAILNRLNVKVLDVEAEIAPGVPVSVAAVPWGRMRIVTKSGGFGPPDLLRRIAEGLLHCSKIGEIRPL